MECHEKRGGGSQGCKNMSFLTGSWVSFYSELLSLQSLWFLHTFLNRHRIQKHLCMYFLTEQYGPISFFVFDWCLNLAAIHNDNENQKKAHQQSNSNFIIVTWRHPINLWWAFRNHYWSKFPESKWCVYKTGSCRYPNMFLSICFKV